MPLPNSQDLRSLDYIYQGSPYVKVPINSGMNLGYFGWIQNGAPFVSNYAYEGTVKTWNGSAWIRKPLKVHNGSDFVKANAKIWLGSSWGILDVNL